MSVWASPPAARMPATARVGPFAAARRDMDAGAGQSQAGGDAEADAAVAAGHDGDLSGQVEELHGAFPCLMMVLRSNSVTIRVAVFAQSGNAMR